MMSEAEKEVERIIGARKGDNEPITLKRAYWDQWRSVRLGMPQGNIGLATTTYSYGLTQGEREQAARRIAALWTLAAFHGWSTDEIEAEVSRLSKTSPEASHG